MHMKYVAALSPDCKSTSDRSSMGAKKTSTYSVDKRPQAGPRRWAAALVRHPTDPTHISVIMRIIVASIPAPLSNYASVLDVDAHRGAAGCEESRQPRCLAECTRLRDLHVFASPPRHGSTSMPAQANACSKIYGGNIYELLQRTCAFKS